MSISPVPTYHLCPTFHIAPPVKGHLDLGTILLSLDVNGISFPLNRGRAPVIVPRELIFPALSEDAYAAWRKGEGDTLADSLWDVKGGVTRTVGQLRSLEGGVWGKAATGVGGKLSWLCERSNNDTIRIGKILTRYFLPTDKYMEDVLSDPGVQPTTDRRGRKQPLYMITGLMIAVDFSLSKAKGKKTHLGAEASAAEPTTGAGGGASAAYKTENTSSADVESSSDIVLGYRVRKIYWEKGVRKTTDDVAGQTLEAGGRQGAEDSIGVVDDFGLDESSEMNLLEINENIDGIEPSRWVL